MIRTRLTLAPGQNGTKKLTRRFGERLVCVRYRYDDATKRRFKTVELVVDEVPWERAVRPDPTVRIRLGIDELRIREAVKAAGGRWLPGERLWLLTLSEVRRLRLQRRIVAEDGSSNADIQR
jgi:hypothetical protein